MSFSTASGDDDAAAAAAAVAAAAAAAAAAAVAAAAADDDGDGDGGGREADAADVGCEGSMSALIVASSSCGLREINGWVHNRNENLKHRKRKSYS